MPKVIAKLTYRTDAFGEREKDVILEVPDGGPIEQAAMDIIELYNHGKTEEKHICHFVSVRDINEGRVNTGCTDNCCYPIFVGDKMRISEHWDCRCCDHFVIAEAKPDPRCRTGFGWYVGDRFICNICEGEGGGLLQYESLPLDCHSSHNHLTRNHKGDDPK